MQKGFTLVELSIVLVIIGLLIGGILVGQSLIESASISRTVSQIQQFDAGVMVFKDKYRYLPGDSPYHGGDGDGLIDRTDTNDASHENSMNAFECEIANFFTTLDPHNFPGQTPCSNIGTPVQTKGEQKNTPESNIGKNNSVIFVGALAMADDNRYANLSTIQNYYYIVGPDQVSSSGTWYAPMTTVSGNAALKPITLLSFDQKLDDGLANSGDILSGNVNSGWPTSGSPYINPLATCSSGADYQIQNDSYECTPLIRIGAQTGEVQ